jgi:hypothetical protein
VIAHLHGLPKHSIELKILSFWIQNWEEHKENFGIFDIFQAAKPLVIGS